jgi:hypothetical protein
MSDTVETAPLAVPRDRSVEARRAKRQAKASQERRIIASLNRGVPVAVIAEWEDVGEKRMRALVRDILARRTPEPRAQFLESQVNRLEEALHASFGAMSRSNLQAVDPVSRSCASSIAITVSPRPSGGATPMRPKRPRKSPHGSDPHRPSGVARKWRRKGLKRLNPRPEMVWPQKRRTHKIWYNGATAPRRSRPRRPSSSRGRGASGRPGNGSAKARED